MTATTYELRTPKGVPVLAFDDANRAAQVRFERERRHGLKLELWRVDRVEERVS